MDPLDRTEIGSPFGEEIGRYMGNTKSEEIADLARSNDDGNACGKACDHRMRNVADDLAKARIAGNDQDDSGQQRSQYQSIISVGRNDVEDDHDEGARRSPDLHA